MNIGESMGVAADAAFKAAGAVFANAPANGKFVVNHDNVLAAAKIIQNQMDTFKQQTFSTFRMLKIAPPGEDTVSTSLAEAWNDKLLLAEDSYAARIAAYVQGLESLVSQLIDTAKAYGHNEDDITAALGSHERA